MSRSFLNLEVGMDTPLYTALTQLAGRDPLRLHMPGHKGRFPFPGWQAAALDFTELPPTGNLYLPGGPIDAAQALWAEAWGVETCQFLTGGSTQGLHAALLLACPPGSTLLADRNSHKAVTNAMALLDVRPVWLMEKTPEGVERALTKHQEARAVLITSPDYYGRLYDVAGIAQVCRRLGAVLVVDGAHGAHLPFLGENPFRDADLTVSSAHKTLPALGQAALLTANGRFSAGELRRAAAIHGTSSPSYVIMASLDLARAFLQGEGKRRYQEISREVAALRQTFPALREGPLDPGRLTLTVKNALEVQKQLMARDIWPEMADMCHVVCILTCCNTREDLARLRAALTELDVRPGDPPPPLPPLPQAVCTPRTALFSPAQTLPLSLCEGRVCAGQIAPYPPGVPIVAPGERIEKKHLAYLQKIGYNMEEGARVLLT